MKPNLIVEELKSWLNTRPICRPCLTLTVWTMCPWCAMNRYAVASYDLLTGLLLVINGNPNYFYGFWLLKSKKEDVFPKQNQFKFGFVTKKSNLRIKFYLDNIKSKVIQLLTPWTFFFLWVWKWVKIQLLFITRFIN